MEDDEDAELFPTEWMYNAGMNDPQIYSDSFWKNNIGGTINLGFGIFDNAF